MKGWRWNRRREFPASVWRGSGSGGVEIGARVGRGRCGFGVVAGRESANDVFPRIACRARHDEFARPGDCTDERDWVEEDGGRFSMAGVEGVVVSQGRADGRSIVVLYCSYCFPLVIGVFRSRLICGCE